jgi:hypothetical protein
MIKILYSYLNNQMKTSIITHYLVTTINLIQNIHGEEEEEMKYSHIDLLFTYLYCIIQREQI